MAIRPRSEAPCPPTHSRPSSTKGPLSRRRSSPPPAQPGLPSRLSLLACLPPLPFACATSSKSSPSCRPSPPAPPEPRPALPDRGRVDASASRARNAMASERIARDLESRPSRNRERDDRLTAPQSSNQNCAHAAPMEEAVHAAQMEEAVRREVAPQRDVSALYARRKSSVGMTFFSE